MCLLHMCQRDQQNLIDLDQLALKYLYNPHMHIFSCQNQPTSMCRSMSLVQATECILSHSTRAIKLLQMNGHQPSFVRRFLLNIYMTRAPRKQTTYSPSHLSTFYTSVKEPYLFSSFGIVNVGGNPYKYRKKQPQNSMCRLCVGTRDIGKETTTRLFICRRS